MTLAVEPPDPHICSCSHPRKQHMTISSGFDCTRCDCPCYQEATPL